MSKLIQKPSGINIISTKGRFEKFNMLENPFPSEPVVNKDSTDKRINGNIFELKIRKKEFDHLKNSFLIQPQINSNHLRLGFIIDTSYIGRGNGKSAFLINVQQMINNNYCLDLSNNVNKCFCLYLSPEPGGRTKSFYNVVDLIANSIFDSDIIINSLAILRIEAISKLYKYKVEQSIDDDILIKNMSTKEWFQKNKYDIGLINNEILKNNNLQGLAPESPLYRTKNSLFADLVTVEEFKQFYFELKKGKERIDFVFTDLIRLFRAAGFNGAYIFIDDFERIPDFQSARQKKDFALELRTCLYDGLNLNAKLGFYNMFLVLHAGVQRLISDAWAESGMENRAPISPATSSKHILIFEKLNKSHAKLLIKKYLEEYRLKPIKDSLTPFTEEAIQIICQLAEFNASKILKLCYALLDSASLIDDQKIIDDTFVNANIDRIDLQPKKDFSPLEENETVDLSKKAKKKD